MSVAIRSALPLALLLTCATAHSATLYVNDKLVVGVYPEMESEDGKLANLETGDAVEELERQDKSIKVRMSDGREGWVKANYLSAQPPAIVRLKELQAAGGGTAPSPPNTQELTQLKEHNATLQKEVEKLKQAAAAQPAPVAVQPVVAQRAANEPAPGNGSGPASTSATPVAMDQRAHMLWAGGALALGALGFLIGYQTLARRIRHKYGRVKIY
ncbi:MAG TPA: hypothetical protein VK629_18610 [Steroidobacteraceae bacterium]|nr:hypothetical protein [Steroidobacteraceae bacterium]